MRTRTRASEMPSAYIFAESCSCACAFFNLRLVQLQILKRIHEQSTVLCGRMWATITCRASCQEGVRLLKTVNNGVPTCSRHHTGQQRAKLSRLTSNKSPKERE